MLAESPLIQGLRNLQTQASPFTDEEVEDQTGKEGLGSGRDPGLLPLSSGLSSQAHLLVSPPPLSAPSQPLSSLASQASLL